MEISDRENLLLKRTGISAAVWCEKLMYDPRAAKIMRLHGGKSDDSAFLGDEGLRDLSEKAGADAKIVAMKGRRTWTRFFKDIVLGWIDEDLLVLWLEQGGFSVERENGGGRRSLEYAGAMNRNSVLLVGAADVVRKVVFTTSYCAGWRDHGYIEKPAPEMWKLYEDGAVWVYQYMGSDADEGKYCLTDFAAEPGGAIKTTLRHHSAGGMDVNRFCLSENGKAFRSPEKLILELKAVVSYTPGAEERPEWREEMSKDSPPTMFGLNGVQKSAPTPAADKEHHPKTPDLPAKKARVSAEATVRPMPAKPVAVIEPKPKAAQKESRPRTVPTKRVVEEPVVEYDAFDNIDFV